MRASNFISDLQERIERDGDLQLFVSVETDEGVYWGEIVDIELNKVISNMGSAAFMLKVRNI